VDKDARFDNIVALIYETAHNAQGPDTIIDAISLELDVISGATTPGTAQRELVRDFIVRTVSTDRGTGAGETGSSTRSDSALEAPARQPHGDGDDDARQLLRRLATHIERSAAMRDRMQKLEEQQAIRHIELAHMPFGLVWVGPALQVLVVNARAEEILREQDGLSMRDTRLCTWVAVDQERLESALCAAMRTDDRKSRLLAIRRRAQTLPLLATVIPAVSPPNPALDSIGPLALVILQDPDQTGFGLEHLQLVYGFTASERALAEALLRNETVESFADIAGVSRNTVRTHLAHLFAKTGTSRQAELVRLLMLARPAG
jgi:DNA-binding CsgD family transcriptional regulator